jgi:hypothetical protein
LLAAITVRAIHVIVKPNPSAAFLRHLTKCAFPVSSIKVFSVCYPVPRKAFKSSIEIAICKLITFMDWIEIM